MAFDPIGAVADRLGSKVKSFVDTVKDVLGIGSDVMPIEELADEEGLADNSWSISGENWYKIMGYQFIVTKTNLPDEENDDPDTPDSEFFYALPIPPQSLIVKPVFANKVTPTIGGVVEEVSDTTFWMITMAGTTGIAPSRGPGDRLKKFGFSTKFREVIATTGLLSGITSNLSKSINQRASAIDALGNGDPIGAINSTITPPLPYSGSAVNRYNNGFTEIKDLEKFFYWYHKLKSNDPKAYKLSFAIYKSNQQWDVVVKDFNIQQNASNPHLYRYSITLQGWNVSSTDEANQVEFDRFGPHGDLQQVNTVGLFGMQDRFAAIKGNLGFIGKI